MGERSVARPNGGRTNGVNGNHEGVGGRIQAYPGGKVMMFLRAIPILLLAMAVALGFWTVLEVRETVRDEFNQQQLVLARQVAARVGATLQTLRLELESLKRSAEDSSDLPTALPPLLRSTHDRAAPHGLVEVRYVSGLTGQSLALDQYGKVAEEAHDETDIYLLQQPELSASAKSSVFIQEAPFAPKERPLMVLATAVDPYGAEQGILYFLVDDRQLAANAVAGIRSGRTGYAWIINAAGIFLAHPVQEYVGQDAFEVRASTQPMISFARINEIQKQRMLTGQEGTSWYISGSHDSPNDDKAVEKLIAFAPIPVGGRGEYRNWSVAVVAPASEVESVVNGLWLKLFAALSPAVGAIALVVVLIFTNQQRQAQELQRAIEAATLRRQKSEARYRTLVESADDLIYTLSGDGRILSANRAALRFLSADNHRNPEDVIGLPIQDIVSPETGEHLLKEVREVIAQKRGVSREHSLVIGDHQYWFNTKLRLLEELGEDGNDGNTVLAISRNMTQKRLMDEQMFNTEKLASLGTLAAGVAHEINNPLAAILGFTDLLLEKFSPDTQEYQDLRIIEERGQHCRHIVENLLDYARIGASLGELTNVNNDIEMVLQIVSNTLLTNKINLERNLDPNVPDIRGNPKELQQVFLNLINNAVYAMREKGGTLTISSAVRGNRIMVKVADTGTGIPSEIQNKIFDPFFTTKGVGEGTGLGLSVSLGLVQKLGGTITVKSSTGNAQTGEASGSTFTVILPLPADTEVEQQR